MNIHEDSKKIIRYFLDKAIECGDLRKQFPIQYDELAETLGFSNGKYCRVCCQYLKDMGYIIFTKSTTIKIQVVGRAIDFLESV